VLSYLLFFALGSSFGHGESFTALSDMLALYQDAFADTNLLGTFLENHDNPRFLLTNPSVQAYMSALLFAMYTTGIPISLYGAEALLAGGNDPLNRAPLWTRSFDQTTEMYIWLQQIMFYRSEPQVWSFAQVEQVADDLVYAFSRGTVFVALTNQPDSNQTRSIAGGHSPYNSGDRICNLFWPADDCIDVDDNGSLELDLNQGEQKIYDLESTVRAYHMRAELRRVSQTLSRTHGKVIDKQQDISAQIETA
jgi:alpha-amylase